MLTRLKTVISKSLATLVLLVPLQSYAKTDSGLKLSIEVTFGTHDITSRIGLLAFAIAQKDNIAGEFGTGIWAQGHLRRFGASTRAWSIAYDAFGTIGIGDNTNLLGSALSESVRSPLFQSSATKGFFGLGYGVINEHISGSLNKFGQKRGKVIIRAASKTSSLHITFSNDFRQTILRGGATDYGQTAAFAIKYNQINNHTLKQYGIGFDIFTPQADSNKPANNPQNSAEGRKRVWYTTKPWQNLFYANLYIDMARHTDQESLSAKLGIDSPKIGADAQNFIHDSFGLLPRFPWPIDKDNKLFFEATASKSVR